MKANDYIKKRKKSDLKFAAGYDQGLGDIKLSLMFQEARKKGRSQKGRVGQ